MNSLNSPGCGGIKFASVFGYRGMSMSDTATIRIDRLEEEILTYEISDEALESAATTASKQSASNTLVCTFFHYCPI